MPLNGSTVGVGTSAQQEVNIEGRVLPGVSVNGVWEGNLNSTATNTPPHVPSGGTFVKSPSNRATITLGSTTVSINGKPAARNGDPALTCNDPDDLPAGTVVAAWTVLIG
jgi:uncharacterized Zn-binding protein involved in type VI secretion